MATTKTKKNKEVSTVEETKKAKGHPLIKGPRITEKSAIGAQNGIYTFNVTDNANKSEIKKAIKTLYGVNPVKVTVTQITSKVVMRRGVLGTKQGGKKVVVYLKKGDKIAFV